MENNPVKRRLMAILAADAVGYSRMMGENEELTIRVLAGHREAIDALIANYGARIVGTAGDSVLAEFSSAVDAVRCATEIQDAVRERNEKLPEHERMWFRIGVNLGDVIVSEADVHGDGVNVAVRLESIAEPGGVCISSSVYDQISGKLNLGFTDIGEQNLKNISRPIRAYRFAGPVPPIVPRPAMPARRPGVARRWAWSIAALAVVALAAAWQAGLLPHADGDAKTAKAEAERIEAARIEAARAEQERRAVAERQKMEADLARAKAEAEAAKEQAATQAAAAADARRSLEAQRAAEAKARAEAELARARAEAEAIKRDAQAQSFAATRAREQAEASAAQARALEEAAAKAAADAQARQAAAEKAQQAAAAKTQQAAAAKAAASAERRYDGTWVALHACEATRLSPEVSVRLPADISQGAVRVRRARPGENGYVALDGKIAANGSLALKGMLIVGSGRFAGEERTVHYEGRLEGDRFMLKGEVGRRPCTMELSRLGS